MGFVQIENVHDNYAAKKNNSSTAVKRWCKYRLS